MTSKKTHRMDVHVHRAIIKGLRLRGVDVLTAQEDGYRTASDARLLDQATELRLKSRYATMRGEKAIIRANHCHFWPKQAAKTRRPTAVRAKRIL